MSAEPVEYLETEEVYMQLNQNEIMETEPADDIDDHWEHNSIKMLLNLYLQNVDKFRSPKVKKKNVWIDIANAVGKGPDCCDKKFRNLKQTYIRLLKKRNRNEVVVVKWPYFEVFEKIYNVNGEYQPEIQQRIQEASTESVTKALLSIAEPSTYEQDVQENGESSNGQSEESKRKLNRRRYADFRKITLEMRNRQRTVEEKSWSLRSFDKDGGVDVLVCLEDLCSEENLYVKFVETDNTFLESLGEIKHRYSLGLRCDFRSSKSNLSKSKEKLSPDGAEEKLLPKEVEAKIVTRVDMADAKYVVEDHRNGDAKIELDANKRLGVPNRVHVMQLQQPERISRNNLKMSQTLRAEVSSYLFFYNRIFYNCSLLADGEESVDDQDTAQFSGLTKEELLKYADDPFWVNLRWAMFILFWALWLAMLAGAITIIVKAPKYLKGLLVDMEESPYAEIEDDLQLLEHFKVQGVFVDVPTYEIIDENPSVLESFKRFVSMAKSHGIKTRVIVDLIPNYVPLSHMWFRMSENKTDGYDNYFVWKEGNFFDESGRRVPPNNWVSTLNQSAWTWSEQRKAYYLHQYDVSQPDLNFHNEEVVKEFDNVLKQWMKAGAAGVRLNKVRQLLVNTELKDEQPLTGRGSDLAADHTYYSYWRHTQTTDQPKLMELLQRWAKVVDDASEAPGTGSSVFTLNEEGGRAELFLLHKNITYLRPLVSKPLTIQEDVSATAAEINERIAKWPALNLRTFPDTQQELVAFELLLPASPILNPHQLEKEDNETTTSESLAHFVSMRDDASIQHGHYVVAAVPARNSSTNTLLAVARWKTGHTGYVALFNPLEEDQRANLTAVSSIPDTLTPHFMSHAVRQYTNYSLHNAEPADNLLVPPKSSVVFSYVPRTSAEN
ncbi:hypothetical protein HW555_008345 [Spodoptera exigua]|uniref:alpha-glucosidase n=1 Tax=Spodoptera exigua TaxID=7107 RepID=A0A835GEJ8_SPOEX|nr:hypothetical protein HW555_008345 [Spodoptera exigua]